jgi:hypothetical protein
MQWIRLEAGSHQHKKNTHPIHALSSTQSANSRGAASPPLDDTDVAASHILDLFLFNGILGNILNRLIRLFH